MTTKNIVPRADGEGELGTSSKKWDKVQARTGSFDHIQTTTMASEIYTSGSTKFGDTSDDTHQFTGSIHTSGSVKSTGTSNRPAFIADGNSTNEGDYVVPVGTHLVMGEHANDGNPGGLTTHLKIEHTTGDVTIYNNLSASNNISASAFYGDGQYLDNISTEWDGTRNGDAEITGSLTMEDSSGIFFNDSTDGGIASIIGERVDSGFVGWEMNRISISSSAEGTESAGIIVDAGTSDGILGGVYSQVRMFATGSNTGGLSGPAEQISLALRTPGKIADLDGNLEVSGSGEFGGTLSASAFYGDGQHLDNISADWDGTHNGDAEITGTLTVRDDDGIILVDTAGSEYAKIATDGGGGPMQISSSAKVNVYTQTGFNVIGPDDAGGSPEWKLRTDDNGTFLETRVLKLDSTNQIYDNFIFLTSASSSIDPSSYHKDRHLALGYDSSLSASIITAGNGINALGSTVGNELVLRTNNNTSGDIAALKIDVSGNVGIGTMDPTALLDVSGNIATTGQIYNSGEDKGTETADFTIDWNEGMTQEFILSGAVATTLTASFSNVKPYATYQLVHKIGKDNMAIYFDHPAGIYWPGGTRPTLSTTSGSVDVLTFTTDGNSNLYGVAQYNFSASVG